MGDRLTLRKSSVWPTVSLVVGGVVVFVIGLASLHAIIRSYAEPAKDYAPRRLEMALAGVASGLGGSTVVQTIRITPQTDGSAPAPAPPASAAPPPAAKAASAPRPARPEPRGAWDMATPPTWLATVDAGAGLGVPTEVDPSAPTADTIPRPKAVGLAAVTALALPPRPLVQAPAAEPSRGLQKVAQAEDVPLPRVRPKPPARAKVTRKRGRR